MAGGGFDVLCGIINGNRNRGAGYGNIRHKAASSPLDGRCRLQSLSAMLGDPVCMASYEGAFSEEKTHGWLGRQIARYDKYGFGLWAVVLKSSGEMIGQCGLTWQKHEGRCVLEIGYLLQRKFWHCGYAVEAAEGCKRYAFEKLEATEVFSMVRVANIPAINVAIRIGMTVRSSFTRRFLDCDMAHYAFSVQNLVF